MSYTAWLETVDRIAAMVTGGMMHDDLDFDWRDAWQWGEHPARAVNAAVRGVQTR